MTQLQAPGSRRSPLRQALLGELARRRATPAEIIRRTGSGPVSTPYAQTRLWLVSQLEEGARAAAGPLPRSAGRRRAGRLPERRRPAARGAAHDVVRGRRLRVGRVDAVRHVATALGATGRARSSRSPRFR